MLVCVIFECVCERDSGLYTCIDSLAIVMLNVTISKTKQKYNMDTRLSKTQGTAVTKQQLNALLVDLATFYIGIVFCQLGKAIL